MKLNALVQEIRAIAQRGGGFGSEVELALRELAAALDQRPEWELNQLEKALKPKPSRTKRAVTFDDTSASDVVCRYVEQLQRKQPTSDALTVLASAMKDKRVKRDELYEIAGRFLGARIAFKKKADAEAAIRDRLTRRDWDEASIKSIAERAKT